MKTYTIYFDESYKVEIKAKNSKEAREKFMNAEYDNPEYLEISGYDVVEK